MKKRLAILCASLLLIMGISVISSSTAAFASPVPAHVQHSAITFSQAMQKFQNEFLLKPRSEANQPLSTATGVYTGISRSGISTVVSRSGNSVSVKLSGQGITVRMEINLTTGKMVMQRNNLHQQTTNISSFHMGLAHPSVSDSAGYSSWWDAFSTCMSWPVTGIINVMSGVFMAFGTLAAGVYTLLAVTLPAWAVWAGILGAFAFLGVTAFCTGYATAWWFYGL